MSKILNFEQVKSLGIKLQRALEQFYLGGEIDSAKFAELKREINIATVMAGLWVTSPVSSKPMFRALTGGNTAIMAANTQMTVSIPGLMLASQEKGAPLLFESAMSEVNLQEPNIPPKIASGYTGKSPAEFAEAIRYYAFLLGYDLPYAIHADHTTVSKDTPEAIDYARRLNSAQLAAGYTSFAIDPSSIPAVREETQLRILNTMSIEEFVRLGIDESLAERIKAHGEFKKLKDISSLEGMDVGKINILMDYIESKILVAVLNQMTYEDLMLIPRMTEEIAHRIIAHGKFSSLEELKDIDGLGEDDIIMIEGMMNAVLMFDYLKTYLDLKRIIEINHELAKLIPAEFGLEVEVGHIGRVDPLTGETEMTTPLEAVVMIEAIHNRGIKPDLLAVN
ncbi:MAG: helix-hairpin-helix domain-containing protein, partial [Candidatus Omnitrophota bacterium]